MSWRINLSFEIETKNIQHYHLKYLKKDGVTIPHSKNTAKFYWLIYLFQKLKKVVTKKEIEDFIKKHFPNLMGDQQVRHLKRDGLYLLTRNDCIPNSREKIKQGTYMLYSMKQAHPQFIQDKRLNSLSNSNWNTIKQVYNYQCSTWGSKEGEEHRYFKGNIVTLQKGHMNPNKSISKGNIIPQCSQCNDFYRGRFIFDKYGRIKEIAE